MFVTNFNRFLLVAFLSCNAFYFNLPYNRFTHITLYTQSTRLIPTIYNGKCLVFRLNNAAFSYIRNSYVSSIIDVARTVFTKAKFA